MDDLFSFELDLGAGEGCMTEERLEDAVYNCLDYCLLYGKTPHFYLGGPDPIRHPALWPVLELLREEGTSFSHVLLDAGKSAVPALAKFSQKVTK